MNLLYLQIPYFLDINNKSGNCQYSPYNFTTTFVGNGINQDDIIEKPKTKKQVPLEYYWDNKGYKKNFNNKYNSYEILNVFLGTK